MLLCRISLIFCLSSSVAYAQDVGADKKPDANDDLRKAIELNTTAIKSLKISVDELSGKVSAISNFKDAIESLEKKIATIPEIKSSIDGLKENVGKLKEVLISFKKPPLFLTTGSDVDQRDPGLKCTDSNIALCSPKAIAWCESRGYKNGVIVSMNRDAPQTRIAHIASLLCHD